MGRPGGRSRAEKFNLKLYLLFIINYKLNFSDGRRFGGTMMSVSPVTYSRRDVL